MRSALKACVKVSRNRALNTFSKIMTLCKQNRSVQQYIAGKILNKSNFSNSFVLRTCNRETILKKHARLFDQ